ncbi:hypothetical protein K440DRAFT_662004 [Wilcoxina mikolae CBS 423.85]|nr:hypothetical protein K440DRAFT_662004 [Wilcoxina mikolae CBS 423.85]
MEGLGIAANVIAVVDLAAKACGVVYEYAKSAKGYPKAVIQLQKELESVKISLDGLRGIADKLEGAIPSGEQLPVISQLSGTLGECQTTLEALTKDLEGHFSNKLREKLGRQLKWPMKEPQVMEFVQRLQRYQQNFQPALQADLATVALRTEVAVHEASAEIWEVRSEQLQDIQDRAVELKREKLSQLVKWLAPLHYNTKHEDSFEKHQEGTGLWLFKNDKLRESCVIEQLQNSLLQGYGFAYFYCQYNREETGNPPNIVRTILAQLLFGLDCMDIEKAPTGDLFSKMEKGHGPPGDMKRLAELTVAAAALYQRSTIIIDELDECPLDMRRPLLGFITHLPRLSNTRILVMSRREVDIEDELGVFPTLSLKEEKVNLKEDMRKHIEEEFKDTKKWGHTFQTMQEEITESLIRGSGMNMLRTPKAIREALTILPQTLFKTYDRMLELIEEDQAGELAAKAFFLVAHLCGHLSLEQLVEAIAPIDHNNCLDWSATFVDPRQLLGEYLVSDYLRKHDKYLKYAIEPIEPRDGDQAQLKIQARIKISAPTLKYLLLEDFSQPCSSDGELAQRIGKFRFYRYCAVYWFDYRWQVEHEDLTLLELVNRFIFDSPGSLRSYQQMAYGRIDGQLHDQFQLVYKDMLNLNYELSDTLFLLLIKNNCRWIVAGILERRPQLLNADLCNFGPPLRIAISNRHCELATDILALGADIHMPFRDLLPTDYIIGFGTNHPHIPGMFQIIELGKFGERIHIVCVAVNLRTEYIILTVAQFAPKLLPHLLESKIDVNIRAGDGASSTHYATLGDNLEALKALVAAGADINAETHGGRTAFHIAVSIHSPAILVYLLDSIATVPPDITIAEVQAVVDSPNLNSVTGDVERLSQMVSMIPREHTDCPDIPCDWVRAEASRRERQDIAGPNADPYLSFTFQGTQLRRLHFRLFSTAYVKYTGVRTIHPRNPYYLSFSWLEAAIIKSATLAEPATHDSPSKFPSVLPRCIQQNVIHLSPSYHSVIWDVRDPTPGIKEWLESVQTGDMIVVYPNASDAYYGTHLEAVEMEVYWES